MFATVDYLITAGIQKKLNFLSHNPHHLYYLLERLYCNKDIRDIVGQNYIKEAVEFIINNRIQVGPAYNLDTTKFPSVAVQSNGSETDQYIGDYGYSQVQKVCPPTIYYRFDAKAIDNDTLTTSALYGFDTKLWRNIHIGNGAFISSLQSVYNSADGNSTVIQLKDPIPEGTLLKDWAVLSDDRYRGVIYSASTDTINASIILTTSGSYSLHYLLSVVIRYCLKSNRMYFDSNGLQVASMNYSIPVINDQTDNVFQNQYTVSGKFTEYWIESEYPLPDAAGNYTICLTAESSNPNNEDVQLSGSNHGTDIQKPNC